VTRDPRAVADAGEKRDPVAEHDGHEVDHDLVAEPGVETESETH